MRLPPYVKQSSHGGSDTPRALKRGWLLPRVSKRGSRSAKGIEAELVGGANGPGAGLGGCQGHQTWAKGEAKGLGGCQRP